MKRTSCLVAVLILAVSSVAFAGLPPVRLTDTCATVPTIDTEADGLLTLLAFAGLGDLPSYWTADLEAAMTGDGIPDSCELALLGSALCAVGRTPDEVAAIAALRGQFATNLGLVNALLDKLTLLIPIALGDGDTKPSVDVRLAAAADIITSRPVLMSIPDLATAAAELDDMAVTVSDFLNDPDNAMIIGMVPGLPDSLRGVVDFVAGLVGLSTEMQGTVTDLIDQYSGDITGIVAQVAAARDAFIALKTNPAVTPPLTADEIALIDGMVADVNFLIDTVDWLLNLTDAVAIYGTAGKAAGEPFSAAGDYDGDGVTNGAVAAAILGETASWTPANVQANRPAFVAAASGDNPFWNGNPTLPAVGVVGLGLLAGIVALGGAMSIRKK